MVINLHLFYSEHRTFCCIKWSIFFQAQWSFLHAVLANSQISVYCCSSVAYCHTSDQVLLSPEHALLSSHAEDRALLWGYPHSLHISALHRLDVTHITTVVHQNPRTGTLYHNCNIIAALPHSLKQFPGLFRLQSYPCQAESANQSPAQWWLRHWLHSCIQEALCA